MKINQILDKIDEKQLFIPAFQREYIWKRDHAKNLIASLIRKYPTGTMLTWETNRPPELKGGWEYRQEQGSVRIILDGQQRITTLYMLIRDKLPPYYTVSEIKYDPRDLYINIETLDLQYYKKTMMQNNPYWQNVTDIFQRKIRERDVFKAIEDSGKELSREQEDTISDNLRAVENIPDSEFLEQTIPIKAEVEEAIDIFYIVNASGVNLTDAELALAQISGYWPTAREKFKKKLEALKENGFVFKLDFIIYCLLGVLHNKGSDMTKLHSRDNKEKLRAAWEKLDNEVLDYVADILRSHAFVDHTKEINSVYALVPIIVYVFNKGNLVLSQDEINKIIKWFYYSQIRQRYISQLPQKLDKDIGVVVKSENPFDELLNIIKLERPLEISPDEFIGVGVQNALYNLMIWYFKSRSAVCFTTGVGIRKNIGKKYLLEKDHIFPSSILKENGYNQNNRHKYALAQEITNRVILTQIANRRKNNKLAKDYLAQVKQEFPTALALQSIPEDESLWELDAFEDFLQARREMLTKELNNFLQNITVTEESVSEITLGEIIREGESNELELKSSLRWNYEAGMIDKKLENVILKSIAAFGNSDGGTLLIGVDDDGQAIGLDRDFTSLNGNKDEFELHLRNLINESFGKLFATSGLKIEFPIVDDVEICRIDISPRIKPIYFEIADKNGQKAKKFYVRSGNSSQELDISEVNDYINSRWNNR